MLLLLVSITVFADYPIFSQRYTADPSGIEYNGRLYVYCSADFLKIGSNGPELGYYMKNITCISTDDMKNWTDHGEVFDVKDCKWGANLSWAPSIVRRNNKFYLYYGNGLDAIGVAVSDSPTGPFVDQNNTPIVDRNTPGVMPGSGNWGMWCFDPGVFVDDDDQAYMYFGGSHADNARVIKLKENMIEVDGAAVKLNTPGFFEASYMHKYNGKYYLSYAGHHFSYPANIEYVMSDKPMEGFDNVGLVLANPPVNDEKNNHHSIFQFRGDWYIAYHNRQTAVNNKVADHKQREFMRSVAIDRLYYNVDGTIKQVIPTVDGVVQLEYFDPYKWTSAAIMARSHGVNTTSDGKGGRYLSEIKDGSWIALKGVDFSMRGAKRFIAKVASDGNGGKIEVRLGDPGGRLIGTIDVNNTGGKQQWTEKSCLVSNAVGIRDLYLVFRGQGNNLFTLAAWQFDQKNNYTATTNNPIIQTKLTADPAPLVHNGVVYLYTTRDQADPENGMGRFRMRDWLLYTSTDMVNWTDHGVIASLDAFAWANHDNGAWAPECIERNGKFYLYCPLHGKGIGVLVADTPYGPFVDPIGKPLVYKGWQDIDPSILIDDDGRAYMYWGNPDLYYVKLNEDMISYSGEVMQDLSKPDNYQEGPWNYKRNGIYYLAYASTCCPEGMGYAMSDKPFGAWKAKGYIMDPDGRSSGNHPGIIDFKGKTYVFGFNYALHYATNTRNVHSERRSVCVDEMIYNADGTIQKLPWWNAEGLQESTGAINPYKRVEAETIAWSDGLETAKSAEAGMYVTAIHDGDYIKVRNVDFGKKSATTFMANVAAVSNGGSIEIRLNSPTDGILIGMLSVSVTGGAEQWEVQSTKVKGLKGKHDVFFIFKGDSSDELFNFDYWSFK